MRKKYHKKKKLREDLPRDENMWETTKRKKNWREITKTKTTCYSPQKLGGRMPEQSLCKRVPKENEKNQRSVHSPRGRVEGIPTKQAGNTLILI
jgi:hypothetical protein